MIDPTVRATFRGLAKGELPWPLFLWGPPGTGKSCAALSLLDHAGGLYFTAALLGEDAVLVAKGELQYPGSGHRITPKGFWREISETPLVVLDELGTRAKASEWQYEQVKRLLDAREGLPLVCVANHDLGELAQVYDDRVASRLAAGTVFLLGGEDRRLVR